MKLILLVLFAGTLIQAASVSAMPVQCYYQQTACDEKGDHYDCIYMNWTESGEFCSATGHVTLAHPPVAECSKCYSEVQEDKFCREVCGCDSFLCGSW